MSQKTLILISVLIPVGVALLIGSIVLLANHQPKKRKLAKPAEWYYSLALKLDLKIDTAKMEILFVDRSRRSSRVSVRRSKRGSMVSQRSSSVGGCEEMPY